MTGLPARPLPGELDDLAARPVAASRWVDVRPLGTGTAWALAREGTAMFTDDGGHTWRDVWSRTDAPIRALATLGSEHVYLVGDDGTLLHSRNGGLLFAPMRGSDVDFSGVSPTEDGMFVTSFDGRIWHYADRTRSFRELLAVDESLHAITRTTDGATLIAVGDAATWLQSDDDGRSWVEHELPTERDLHAVHATSDAVIAVGEAGVLVVWDGWGPSVEETLDDETTLRSVHVDEAGNGVALGDDGMALFLTERGRHWEARHLKSSPEVIESVVGVEPR